MHSVQGRKELYKESGGIFPSIDDVGKHKLGVTVTSQALGKAEPSWKAGDNGSDPIDILSANRLS